MEECVSPFQERFGMKNISPVVLSVIARAKSAQQEEVVREVLEQLSSTMKMESLETLKKRIYDSIQILSAAELILKVGKTLVYKGRPLKLPDPSSIDRETEERIAEKKTRLLKKIKILTRYEAIIAVNTQKTKDDSSISLPFIIIGIRDQDAKIIQTIDRKCLTFESNSVANFLSPMEVLESMNYGDNFYNILCEKSRFAGIIKEPLMDIL